MSFDSEQSSFYKLDNSHLFRDDDSSSMFEMKWNEYNHSTGHSYIDRSIQFELQKFKCQLLQSHITSEQLLRADLQKLQNDTCQFAAAYTLLHNKMLDLEKKYDRLTSYMESTQQVVQGKTPTRSSVSFKDAKDSSLIVSSSDVNADVNSQIGLADTSSNAILKPARCRRMNQ